MRLSLRRESLTDAEKKEDYHAITASRPIFETSAPTHDQVVLENYDDKNYGYLRIVVTAAQLRIEYHPASDGPVTKTPDDFVTVDLKSHKLVQFNASDLGRPAAARKIAAQ